MASANEMKLKMNVISTLPKVEHELQRMLSNGVIKEITETTDWCSPIVPVLKKNGDVR